MTLRHFLAAPALVATIQIAGAQASADSAPRFGRIASVRELRDGQVLVADAGRLKTWLLSADLSRGSQVGRTGEGPGAYQSADLLVPAGDTTHIFDFLAATFVPILPNGTIGSARPIRRASSAPNALAPEIRASDASGAIYFTGSRANPGAPGTRDSMPLLRRAIETERADTVAWLRIPVSGLRRAKNADSLILSRPDPFEWRDTWTVEPSGRVAIVRGDDYRVEWLSGGRVTLGATIGGERVPVQEADVERLRNRRRMVSGPNGQITITDEPAHAITPIKPFVAEGQQPLIDPMGRLWVERSAPAGSETTPYDLIDGTGKVTYGLALKDKVRAVGFGESTIYAAKPAAGGGYSLIRARLPR